MKSLTIDQLKMLFGFVLLIELGILCGIVAIGHVRPETSAGLDGIIGGLLVLAGGFSNWAFDKIKSSSGEEPKK